MARARVSHDPMPMHAQKSTNFGVVLTVLDSTRQTLHEADFSKQNSALSRVLEAIRLVAGSHRVRFGTARPRVRGYGPRWTPWTDRTVVWESPLSEL